MVFKITDKWKKLLFTVIMLYIALRAGVQDEMVLIGAVFILILLIINYKYVVFPKIIGFKIYGISIAIMLIYGLISAEVDNYIKGMFHVLSVVVVVILGYYLCVMTGDKKSLFLTMEICGIGMSMTTFIRGLMNIGELGDIEGLRLYFGSQVYELSVIFVVLLFICVYRKKIIATRFIDLFAIILLGLNIIISLGRAQIFAILFVLILMNILNFIFEKNKIRVLRRFSIVLIALAILIGSVAYFMPYDIKETFFQKTENSSMELNSNASFKHEKDIYNNWRGYEIKNAQKQWRKYNTFEMVFGGGVQKQIKISNLPSHFTRGAGYTFQNNKSPILHNGYYTLLVKGGVLAIVGVLIWLLAPLFMIFWKKNDEESKDILLLMISLNAMYIIYTYVVRGVVDQIMHLSYGPTIGWLNACYYNPDIRSKMYE